MRMGKEHIRLGFLGGTPGLRGVPSGGIGDPITYRIIRRRRRHPAVQVQHGVLGVPCRIAARGIHSFFRIAAQGQAGIVQKLRRDGKPLGAVKVRLKVMLRQNQKVYATVQPAVEGEVRHLGVDIAVRGVVRKDGYGIDGCACGFGRPFGSCLCPFGAGRQKLRDIYRKGGKAALVAAGLRVIDIYGSAEG